MRKRGQPSEEKMRSIVLRVNQLRSSGMTIEESCRKIHTNVTTYRKYMKSFGIDPPDSLPRKRICFKRSEMAKDTEGVEFLAQTLEAHARRRHILEKKIAAGMDFQVTASVPREELDRISFVEVRNGDREAIVLRGGTVYAIVSSGGAILSPDRSKIYGTVDTVEDWDWSGPVPIHKSKIPREPGACGSDRTGRYERPLVFLESE